MALRDEIKDQHKAIADKSFKYKLDYFLEYYKYATIAVIIGIIVIISFVRGIVTAKDDAFYAICVNAITMPNADVFGEYIEIDPKEEKVVFDTSYSMTFDGGNQNSYISLQKIVASIAAGSADIIIGDTDVLENMGPNEFYADLRDYFTKEQLDAMGDKVIYTQYQDEDGNPIGDPLPVVIDVSDSPLLNSNPFFVDKVGFAIIVNTARPEKALKFYDFLYDSSVLDRAKESLQPYG